MWREIYRKIVLSAAAIVLLFCAASARAAAGDVLNGEYVFIINTDMSNSTLNSSEQYVDVPQKSGTIYFDSTAGSSQNGLAQAVQEPSYLMRDTYTASSGYIRPVSSDAFAGAAVYSIGQSKTVSGRNYTLTAIGEHCLVWMNDSVRSGYEASGADIYKLGASAAKVYDEKSYPVIHRFDKDGILYYADGSGKLSIMMDSGISSGYFDSDEFWSSSGGVTAIHVNAGALSEDFDSFGPLFAHECQHALNYSMEYNSPEGYLTYMNLWMNEALSVAAMDVYTKGHDANQWLSGFINTSQYLREGRSFIYSGSYPGYTEANYSMPFLFLRYLNTQANQGYNWKGDFYAKFYQQPAVSWENINSSTRWRQNEADRIEYVLRQYPSTENWSFRQALINFYIAIQVQANEGAYGFYGDPIISRKVSGFPVYAGTSGSSVDIEKCGAILVKTINDSFTVPSDAGKDIVFIAFTPGDYQKGLQTAGTAADPHIVTNAEELSYIWDPAYDHDCFELESDFEADEGYYNFWIDNYYNYNMSADQHSWPDFYGVLNGNGHTISGLRHPICRENHGLIKGINAECELSLGAQSLGAIACCNYGSIENCAAHGTISIPNTISSYYSNQYAWIGGICGDMRNSTTGAYPSRLSGCMSDVSISGELDVFKYFYIGGLVGSCSVNTGEYDLSDCYSAASLDISIKNSLPGAVVLGGIIGDDSDALTKNCYSVATVSFTNGNGGDMSGKLYTGRALGRSSFADAYQNVYSLSGYPAYGGYYTAHGISSASETQMRNAGTYSGFDFTDVWDMPGEDSPYPYPVLRHCSAPDVSALMGDVNMDGRISLIDAVLICRAIAEPGTLSERAAALGNVNGDETINVTDVLLVCRYVAGLISSFPAEQG